MEKVELINNLYALRSGLSIIAIQNEAIAKAKFEYLGKLYGISDDAHRVMAHGANKRTRFYTCLPLIDRTAYYAMGGGYVWPNDLAIRGFDEIIRFGKNPCPQAQKLFEEGNYYNQLKDYLSKKNNINIEVSSSKAIDSIIAELLCLPANGYSYGNFGDSFDAHLVSALWYLTDECKHYYETALDYWCNQKTKFRKKPIRPDFIEKYQYIVNYALPQFTDEIKSAAQNYNALTQPMIACRDKFFNALIEQFNALFDVRDWKNLDLAIFALETRRADTIKEALQYVDDENRTQRIVQAIEMATKQICNTLEIGFASINQTIITCSQAISAQLSNIDAHLTSKMSELTNAINMGNALKEKANISSERLVGEMTQIKNLLSI